MTPDEFINLKLIRKDEIQFPVANNIMSYFEEYRLYKTDSYIRQREYRYSTYYIILAKNRREALRLIRKHVAIDGYMYQENYHDLMNRADIQRCREDFEIVPYNNISYIAINEPCILYQCTEGDYTMYQDPNTGDMDWINDHETYEDIQLIKNNRQVMNLSLTLDTKDIQTILACLKPNQDINDELIFKLKQWKRILSDNEKLYAHN